MAKLGEQRRLAAIFAADMVGYSRLMETDERGTIARQKAHRNELIEPEIAAHNGRIVKTMGDGLLVEFASVVDAVECAVSIQRAMAEREADVPEERRIQYRVGVNLGDTVIDDDDINVAARLEGLAEPGGICLSQQAYDQVETELSLPFEDLGSQRVKNIARPARVFRVLSESKAGAAVVPATRNGRRLGRRVRAAACPPPPTSIRGVGVAAGVLQNLSDASIQH